MLKIFNPKCPVLFTVLSIFLFMLSLISCDKIPAPENEITLKDGLIFKQGDAKPLTGTIRDTIDGKIIEYDVVDGKKYGKFKTFFENGQLEMEGQIKDDLNEGKWIYYYRSGNIESEGMFKDDLPDGTWKWFYENGKIKEEGTFIKGMREGRWVIYDIDGKISQEKFFIKNIPQEGN